MVCTDGGRGTTDPSVDPATWRSAGRASWPRRPTLLGLASYRGARARPTASSTTGPSSGPSWSAWIRRFRPDVVLGHDPTAVFFGQDYFNHRDHRAAGWALLDALSPAAALPHYFPEAGPPHQVTAAYLSGTLEPDVWVDISASVDVKVAAVECHRSQFAGRPTGGPARSSAVAGRGGGPAGRRPRYAEGFRRLRLGG